MYSLQRQRCQDILEIEQWLSILVPSLALLLICDLSSHPRRPRRFGLEIPNLWKCFQVRLRRELET